MGRYYLETLTLDERIIRVIESASPIFSDMSSIALGKTGVLFYRHDRVTGYFLQFLNEDLDEELYGKDELFDNLDGKSLSNLIKIMGASEDHCKKTAAGLPI